jgi:uncharacterized protein YggT (Ycf19 family)
MRSTSDGKSTFLKIARVLTWLVYAYAILAAVFLVLGFILLLFGANPAAGFTHFVYNITARFLQPFREIFPGQQIGDRGYFSAAGLFAIIVYGIAAAALHSLITFISLKQAKHQAELDALLADGEAGTQETTREVRHETTATRYQSPQKSRHVQI